MGNASDFCPIPRAPLVLLSHLIPSSHLELPLCNNLLSGKQTLNPEDKGTFLFEKKNSCSGSQNITSTGSKLSARWDTPREHTKEVLLAQD